MFPVVRVQRQRRRLRGRLGALETTDDIKVVSSPRIATLDNKAAKISQGAKIPFLSTSQQGTQTQFVDATLELNVTPHIAQNNTGGVLQLMPGLRGIPAMR